MNKILRLPGICVLMCWAASSVLADQVIMQNGDVFTGKLLAVTTNVVVLKNDNLGVVNLLRARVAGIHFGTGIRSATQPPATSTNPPVQDANAHQTNDTSVLVGALRGIQGDTNLAQQVQAQIIGAGNPEATAKFNELIEGLGTGKIDLNHVRQQAQSAADEIRSLKKDLGPDAGDDMDSYLTVLDEFLNETASPKTVTTTNSVTPPAKSTDDQAAP